MSLKLLFAYTVLFMLGSCSSENINVMPEEVSLTKLINHSDDFWGKTVVTFGYTDIISAGDIVDQIWLYPSKDQSEHWDRTSLVTIQFANAEGRKHFIEGCNNTYITLIGRYVDNHFNGGRTLILHGFTEKPNKEIKDRNCYFEYDNLLFEFRSKIRRF